MRNRDSSSASRSKRGSCGPLRDGMTVTYTDIRDTLDAIAKAHKTVQAKRDRRVARQFATRNKAVR